MTIDQRPVGREAGVGDGEMGRPGLSVILAEDVEARRDKFHRMRQPDLGGGIRERERVRRSWTDAGGDPASLSVALDIDVLIADDAPSARTRLSLRGEEMFGSTVRYVGTARGLVSLIVDVYSAHVADAVVLHAIDRGAPDPGCTSALLAREVLPLFHNRSRCPRDRAS
ncbi:hypothetical protein BH93_19745 [Rhodococcoides fascians A25f]|uniref:hypothetical protein n=1 Tax=Rhodococcoides fascians TaxID=1828 RepID=UPI00068C7996|nr:hypothetical protein [Rhodococcus fascians]QII07299.1 hypothetical protein BH93_19745 [Rhodococcus fascians A25f]